MGSLLPRDAYLELRRPIAHAASNATTAAATAGIIRWRQCSPPSRSPRRVALFLHFSALRLRLRPLPAALRAPRRRRCAETGGCHRQAATRQGFGSPPQAAIEALLQVELSAGTPLHRRVNRLLHMQVFEEVSCQAPEAQDRGRAQAEQGDHREPHPGSHGGSAHGEGHA